MTSLRNEGPIGVFDSGLGGLTVLRALHERLPREDFVYLGDTARTPYGTRGKQTILNYAHACARVLREQRIKALVLACNTLSAVALDSLAGELFLPVLGAIAPGVRAALHAGERKPGAVRHIGVLTTARTAASDAYVRAFASADKTVRVHVQKSPLLVALIEEGWLEGEVTRLTIREYLKPLLAHPIDTLLLGASQYPLLIPSIEAELAAHRSLQRRSVPPVAHPTASEIALVDSAGPLADEVVQLIAAKQLATERTDPGKLRIVLTDLPDDLSTANRLLGRNLAQLSVSAIDL